MTNLLIQVKPVYLYDSVTAQPIVILTMTAEQVGQENNGFVYATTATANLSDTTYPRYADYKAAATSAQAVTMCNGIMASVNADESTSYFTTFSLEYDDSTTQDAINASISSAIAGISTVTLYSGTTVLPNPKIVSLAGSTNSSGVAVFQLTTNGVSTGTAIFSSVPAINIDINSSTAAYGYAYAFSNSNKTLTVTVTQPTSLLSLGVLPNVGASSGVTVNARAFGN